MLDRDRHAAAGTRIHVALDSIQEALRLTEQAAQLLAGVDEMSASQKRLDAVASQLRHTWFGVCATANRLRRNGRLQLR